MQRIPVGILGATGTVGQRFVTLLADHPWFVVEALAASERSAGRAYEDAATWIHSEPIPEGVRRQVVLPTGPPLGPKLLFSALDASVAGEIEAAYADRGHVVVSNARNHRMDPDVPLLVPEVNPDHLALLDTQGRASGGVIVTNPNCSTIGLTLALAPLYRAFGLEAVHVVTLQAVSGAGLPGVSSLSIIDNVVPLISGEEEKLEREPAKILGQLRDGAVDPAVFRVSAHCNRVPVIDGHTECVSVALGREVPGDELIAAWNDFSSAPGSLALPSAPERPVRYTHEPDAPQPRRHRNAGDGMAVTVGRLRPCSVLQHKFVTVSHNTVRGAAGGAILCAEMLLAAGRIPGHEVPG